MERPYRTIDNSRKSWTENNVTVSEVDRSGLNDIIFHPQTLSSNVLSTLSFTSQLSPENQERNVHPSVNKGPSTTLVADSQPLVIDSTCIPDWQRPPEFKKRTEAQKEEYILTRRCDSLSSATETGMVLDKFDFQKTTSFIQQSVNQKYKLGEFQPSVYYWNLKPARQSENQIFSDKTNLYRNAVLTNNRQIQSMNDRKFRIIKKRGVIPNTAHQLSQISDSVYKSAASTYQKAEKNVPIRFVFTTANISPCSTSGQILFTSTKPQKPLGVGQCSTSNNSKHIPKTISVCPTSSETQATHGEVLFTYSNPQEASHKEIQFIADNDLQDNVGKKQCIVVPDPPGGHGEVHTTNIETKDASEEGCHTQISEAQAPPEEDHSTTPSEPHPASVAGNCLTLSGAQNSPDKAFCFTNDKPQCIQKTDKCTTVSNTGDSLGMQSVTSSIPKGTFEYVLCTVNSKMQTGETVSGSGHQRVLFVPLMPAMKKDKSMTSTPPSSPEQSQTLTLDCGRQSDDKPSLQKEENLTSDNADHLSQSQTEQNTDVNSNTLSSTSCTESSFQVEWKTSRLSNTTKATEQTSDIMPLDSSKSLSFDGKKSVTSSTRTNDGQIVLPKTEQGPNTKYLCLEKDMPTLHGIYFHQKETKTGESDQEVPGCSGDTAEARAANWSDSEKQQEYLSKSSAVLRSFCDLYESGKKFQTELCICKTEENTIYHEIEKFDYVQIKTEINHKSSDPDDDRDECNYDKETVVDVKPKKELSIGTQCNLASPSHQKQISKSQKFICVKASPSKAYLGSQKLCLNTQEKQSGTQGNKDELLEKSLLGDNAGDNAKSVKLPKSPVLNNCAENNCETVNTENFSEIVSRSGRQEITENAMDPKESLCSGLKILGTVSLAGMVPAEQNPSPQLKSRGGFYRCGCQGGTCPFRAQLQPNFAAHLRDAHPHEKNYPCVHCGCQETSPGLLLYHLDHHLDFQRFSLYCTQPDCNFHSFSPEEVINHMTIYHPRNDAHVCWCCSQWLGTLQQLKIHIQQNLLVVTLCPYCDAKDTDADRLLHHITMTHPGKGRMIVFHKLLICGESQKVSGQKTTETSVQHMCVSVSEDHDDSNSDKTKETVNMTVNYHRYDNDSTSPMPTMNTDHSGTDNTEQMSGFSDRDETSRKMADQDNSLNHDQRTLEQNAKPQNLLYHSPDDDLRTIKTGAQNQENNHPGNNPRNIEDVSLLMTTEQQGQMNSVKLIFIRKGVHFECFDKQTTHIDKLSMEPVDLEISVDDSVEMNNDCLVEHSSDYSKYTDEPVTSREGAKTPLSSSPLVSSTISPEGPKQDKFYKCTVVSAGRSIKLVSSETMNRQSDPDPVHANKATTRTSKRRSEDRGLTRQIVSSRNHDSKVYSCRLCSFTSHLSRRIYQHMYSRHGHILDCPKCGQRSKTRTGLFNHLSKRHSEEAKALFYQNKVTKWIQITKKARRKMSYKENHVTPVLSALNEQDCPVNKYFVISNHGKERSIHCVLCDYSFKKYHRSNANVYRSMYKHLFLRHISHEFQCPICRFTHDREERIRKHMKERHTGCEQEPEIIVLSQCPTQNIMYSPPHTEDNPSSCDAVRQSRRVRKRKATALADFVTDFSP